VLRNPWGRLGGGAAGLPSRVRDSEGWPSPVEGARLEIE